MSTGYLRKLKRALTGSADTPLVLLCNFEAEAQWARNHVGLPVPSGATRPVVAALEELGVLLAARRRDSAQPPTRPGLPGLPGAAGPGVAHHAGARELPARAIHHRERAGLTGPARSAAPARCGRCPPAADGYHLRRGGAGPAQRPHTGHPGRCGGRAGQQQDLWSAAGRGGRPATCTRSLLRDPAGTGRGADPPPAPAGVGRTTRRQGRLRRLWQGTAGAGKPRAGAQLLRMVDRRAARTGDDRIHVVVEEWLPKRCDLNYQITIARDGRAELDFVKQR